MLLVIEQDDSQTRAERQLQTVTISSDDGNQEGDSAGVHALQVQVPSYQQTVTLSDGITAIIQPVTSSTGQLLPDSVFRLRG